MFFLLFFWVVGCGKGVGYLTSPGRQLILASSWARPAILVASKGRGGMFLLSPAFSKKSGGTLFLVFRGAWCVVRGAWCVVRGAWRVVRGAWFRVFSVYFVPLTPPTVSVRSF